MIKAIAKLTLAVLLTGVVMGAPLRAAAQDTNTVPAVKNTKKARTSTVFNGKLSAMDKVAKSITVENKTTNHIFQVTSQTKIFKGVKGSEKPSTMEEGTIGETVTGSWAKDEDGKMALKTLYFRGTKESPKAAPKKKKVAKPTTTPIPPTTNAVPPDASAPPSKP